MWLHGCGARHSRHFDRSSLKSATWLNRAEREGSRLVGLARDLLAEIGEPDIWVVHGDFHHHNILSHADRYVAIDPKPYAAEREYDVPSFLWNPMDNRLDDRGQLERRIAAFVDAGLDDFRIRAWTVVRGSVPAARLCRAARLPVLAGTPGVTLARPEARTGRLRAGSGPST
jgi:streptomycin 6-kinase